MFRSQTIVHRRHDTAALPAEKSALRVVRLEVAHDETAAMEVYDYREGAFALGNIVAYFHRTGRTGEAGVPDLADLQLRRGGLQSAVHCARFGQGWCGFGHDGELREQGGELWIEALQDIRIGHRISLRGLVSGEAAGCAFTAAACKPNFASVSR